jgi:hypothetical protein
MGIQIGPKVGRAFWVFFSEGILALCFLVALCLKLTVADRDAQGNLRRDLAGKLHDPTIHAVYSTCTHAAMSCAVGFSTATSDGTAKAVRSTNSGWRIFSVKQTPSRRVLACVGAV